jgi:hypothetical protein
MTSFRLGLILLVAALSLACRPAPPGPPQVPKMWEDLGVPTEGLLRVLPDSNEHGFYADYSGHDPSILLDDVSHRLARAGYKRTCTALDGYVVGFTNGCRQLALKVDIVGALYLSLFDAAGKEPLLHGLCFGRYREGPWRTLTQKEKEALARGEEPAAQQGIGPDGRGSR